MLDAAEGFGVPASLEPEPGMLVETVADYAAQAERHPRLRLALDTGHCLVTQDVEPADAVRSYADRIGTVAIEDMARGDHTPFRSGRATWTCPACWRRCGRCASVVCVCGS